MRYGRRKFFEKLILSMSLVLSACGEKEEDFDVILPPADLELKGNESDLTKTESQWNKMQKVAEGKESLKVGFSDESGKGNVLEMNIQDHRLVLKNLKTGQEAYIKIDAINLAPSESNNFDLWPELKFTDASGNILRDREGNLLRYSFSDFKGEKMTASDWLLLGVKIFAIGLAAWLGFKIIGLVIAAIAWLGFNLLVLGILVGAIAAFAWLINKTGWNFEEVRIFFQSFSERIREIY